MMASPSDSSAPPFLTAQDLVPTFSFDSSVDLDPNNSPRNIEEMKDIEPHPFNFDKSDQYSGGDMDRQQTRFYGWSACDKQSYADYGAIAHPFPHQYHRRDDQAQLKNSQPSKFEDSSTMWDSPQGQPFHHSHSDSHQQPAGGVSGNCLLGHGADYDPMCAAQVPPNHSVAGSVFFPVHTFRCGSFDETTTSPAPPRFARYVTEPDVLPSRNATSTTLGAHMDWLYVSGRLFPNEWKPVLRMIVYLDDSNDDRAVGASDIVYRTFVKLGQTKRTVAEVYRKLAEWIGEDLYNIIRSSQTHQSGRFSALRFGDEKACGKFPVDSRLKKAPEEVYQPSKIEIAIAFGIATGCKHIQGGLDPNVVLQLARSGAAQFERMNEKDKARFWRSLGHP